MALARACLNNTHLLRHQTLKTNLYPLNRGTLSILGSTNSYRNSSAAASSSTEVAMKSEDSSTVTKSGNASKRSLWKAIPWPWHNLNNGVGNALMQVSRNLNRALENWRPSRLLGRYKEDDNCYKVRYEIPGLSKEDLKITVEDGYLVITGESKREDEDDDEEDGWYSYGYGYYNTWLLLPDDAKVEDIKAELKNGVLTINIPRTGEAKAKNIREVQIQ